MKMNFRKNNVLDSYFGISNNGSSIKNEILAGGTSFIAIAYILMVNPVILSAGGMNKGEAFTATVLTIIISTLIIGIYTKLPFVQAPGVGLNIFFTYTVVLGMGYSYEFALTAVLLEGIIFILLSIFNVKEVVANSIPSSVKKSMLVGIGLFIALIGLQESGIIIHTMDGGTVFAIGKITEGPALLTIIGVLITVVLLSRKIKGSLFIGMIITAILGIPFGVTEVPKSILSAPPSITHSFLNFQWHNLISWNMVIVVITLFFMNSCNIEEKISKSSVKATNEEKDGLKKKIEISNGIGTILGACFGTSTIVVVSEESKKKEKGKTGFSAIITAVIFILVLFLFPIFKIITPSVTSVALIIIGLQMLKPIKEINLEEYTEAIPAFFTIIIIPFSYSVIDGIVFGIVSYIVLKVVSRNIKQVSLSMVIVTIVFILQFFIK